MKLFIGYLALFGFGIQEVYGCPTGVVANCDIMTCSQTENVYFKHSHLLSSSSVRCHFLSLVSVSSWILKMRWFPLLLILAWFLLPGEVNGETIEDEEKNEARCALGIALMVEHPKHPHPTPYFEKNSTMEVTCICPNCKDKNIQVQVERMNCTFSEQMPGKAKCNKMNMEESLLQEVDCGCNKHNKNYTQIAMHSYKNTKVSFTTTPRLLCDWEDCNKEDECQSAAKSEKDKTCTVKIGKTTNVTKCDETISSIKEEYPKPCGNVGGGHAKMLSIICSNGQEACPFDVPGPVMASHFKNITTRTIEKCPAEIKGGGKIGDTTEISDGEKITLPKVDGLGKPKECHWLNKTDSLKVRDGNIEDGWVKVNMAEWRDWRYKLLCKWTEGDGKPEVFWFRWFIAQQIVHYTDPDSGNMTCHMPPGINNTVPDNEGCVANKSVPICFNHDNNMTMLLMEDYWAPFTTTIKTTTANGTESPKGGNGGKTQKEIDAHMQKVYITSAVVGLICLIATFMVIIMRWKKDRDAQLAFRDVDAQSKENKKWFCHFYKIRVKEIKHPDDGKCGVFPAPYLTKQVLEDNEVEEEDLEELSSQDLNTEEKEALEVMTKAAEDVLQLKMKKQ